MCFECAITVVVAVSSVTTVVSTKFWSIPTWSSTVVSRPNSPILFPVKECMGRRKMRLQSFNIFHSCFQTWPTLDAFSCMFKTMVVLQRRHNLWAIVFMTFRQRCIDFLCFTSFYAGVMEVRNTLILLSKIPFKPVQECKMAFTDLFHMRLIASESKSKKLLCEGVSPQGNWRL